MKNRVLNKIDEHRADIIRIGETVLKTPELGFKEYKTSALVKEEFEKLGITYTDGLAITGVKGSVGNPDAKVNICIIGELDAVKCFGHPTADAETGAAHACGHNAQIASMLGAAYGLVKSGVLRELDGRVTFLAVPAEELVELEFRQQLKADGKISYLAGKQELIHLGAFDDVDIAMMIHSQAGYERPEVFLGGTSLGLVAKNINFYGKAAHGSAPFEGINALNAAMIALMSINANRETFRDEDKIRIHPIITNGGDLVNVIPATARIETYVRGARKEPMLEACRKVDNAVKAGAIAIGADYEIEDIAGYLPLMQDTALTEILDSNVRSIIGEDFARYGLNMTGSTDMGDLSEIMPCIHPTMGGFAGTAHGVDFKVTDPEAAYVLPAKLLAATVCDLLANGCEKALAIKNSFKK